MNEQAWMNRKDHRRHWRFLASYLVEYKMNGRDMAAFMGNLSMGGMFLRDASNLAIDDEVMFSLYLEDKEPIAMRGKVRVVQKRGVGIEFCSDQDEAELKLKTFISNVVIQKLKKALSTGMPGPERYLEVSGVYRDLGDDAEAINVCQRGAAAHSMDMRLYEHLVDLWMRRIQQAAPEQKTDFLVQLHDCIQAGRKVGTSPLFDEAEGLFDNPAPAPSFPIIPPAAPAPLELNRLEIPSVLTEPIPDKPKEVTVKVAETMAQMTVLPEYQAPAPGPWTAENPPDPLVTAESPAPMEEPLSPAGWEEQARILEAKIRRDMQQEMVDKLRKLRINIESALLEAGAKIDNAALFEAIQPEPPNSPESGLRQTFRRITVWQKNQRRQLIWGLAAGLGVGLVVGIIWLQVRNSPDEAPISAADMKMLSTSIVPPLVTAKNEKAEDLSPSVEGEKAPEKNASASLSTEEIRAKVVFCLNRGHKLLEKKKMAAAIEEYKKARDLNPEEGLTYRSLGIAYSMMGKPEQAVQQYKLYLRLVPSAPDAQQLRSMIADFEGTPKP